MLFMKKGELKAFSSFSVKMKLRIRNLYRKACRGSFLTPALASVGVVYASTVVLSLGNRSHYSAKNKLVRPLNNAYNTVGI